MESNTSDLVKAAMEAEANYHGTVNAPDWHSKLTEHLQSSHLVSDLNANSLSAPRRKHNQRPTKITSPPLLYAWMVSNWRTVLQAFNPRP